MDKNTFGDKTAYRIQFGTKNTDSMWISVQVGQKMQIFYFNFFFSSIIRIPPLEILQNIPILK